MLIIYNIFILFLFQKHIAFICFIFLNFAANCGGYKYLGLFPFPVKSHFLWIEHFLEALLSRGHELTILTSFKMKNSHPNLTEILIEPGFDFEVTC